MEEKLCAIFKERGFNEKSQYDMNRRIKFLQLHKGRHAADLKFAEIYQKGCKTVK